MVVPLPNFRNTSSPDNLPSLGIFGKRDFVDTQHLAFNGSPLRFIHILQNRSTSGTDLMKGLEREG
jgi:hypothetical protein